MPDENREIVKQEYFFWQKWEAEMVCCSSSADAVRLSGVRL